MIVELRPSGAPLSLKRLDALIAHLASIRLHVHDLAGLTPMKFGQC